MGGEGGGGLRVGMGGEVGGFGDWVGDYGDFRAQALQGRSRISRYSIVRTPW